jgi:TRAP-type C4-dicarboxylate transport system permease small subunit
MVLLIGLVPLLGDRDTLVDICAAMLFGIFGIKGILSPGEQMGQTILDISLIGMYVVLAFAAALFFINVILSRRKERQESK